MNFKCTGVLEAKSTHFVLEILLTKNTSSRLPWWRPHHGTATRSGTFPGLASDTDAVMDIPSLRDRGENLNYKKAISPRSKQFYHNLSILLFVWLAIYLFIYLFRTSFSKLHFRNVETTRILDCVVLIQNQFDHLDTGSCHGNHEATVVGFLREGPGPYSQNPLWSDLKEVLHCGIELFGAKQLAQSWWVWQGIYQLAANPERNAMQIKYKNQPTWHCHHVIRHCLPSKSAPEKHNQEKCPQTFAHLVHFSNKCVSHVC